MRNPADLKQHGYFASALSEVWDAYWVPERTAKGVATGRKTNIVYTADLIRGVDVFTVDLPGVESDSSLPLPELKPAANTSGTGMATAPMLSGGAVLFAIALMPVLLRWRRRGRTGGTGRAPRTG